MSNLDKIYDYIDSNEKNGLQDAIIFNLLKDYVKGIHELFKSNSNLNSEISLSNEQFSYLKHRLNHYNIYGTFKVNKSIETHLTTKFKTENFFNTVRRVFELNLFTLSDIDENYNEYKKKLDKKIKNKLRILELGCGIGLRLFNLKKNKPKFEMEGIDLSKNSIISARYHNSAINSNIKFTNADIENLKLVKDIDYIISSFTLIYVKKKN